MYISTSGVVIKTVKFSDSDILLTIFSEKYGKITAISKGSKNSKSKLNSGSHLFVYGEYSISMGKSWNYVNSIDVYNSFYKIREDLDRLAYGSYFLELLNYSLEENVPNIKIFKLITSILKILSENECGSNILKPIFELKLLSELGYMPELESCTVCGEKGKGNYFSVIDGGIICEKCSIINDRGTKINKKIPRLMMYILNTDIKAVYKTEINDFYISKLDIILDSYLKYHIGIKKFKSIDFLNMLKKYEE